MKSKGFTLIELLAVIVILAIIAIIAVPIVLNIINESKTSANERSKELYLDAVKQAIANKNLTEEFNPTVCEVKKDNLICDDEELIVEVKGEKPIVGSIQIKDWDVVSDTLVFGEGNITPTSCFNYKEENGGITITRYNSDDEKCKSDVVIPPQIDGKDVKVIGNGAFRAKQLTSVTLPYGIISIGYNSFEVNNIESIIIPNSVEEIVHGAFGANKLTSVIVPNSVKTIGVTAFYDNQLTSVIIGTNITLIESNAFGKNKLTSVVINAPKSQVTVGESTYAVFGWADGYSDDNIEWKD